MFAEFHVLYCLSKFLMIFKIALKFQLFIRYLIEVKIIVQNGKT